jgi:hypothetical protein
MSHAARLRRETTLATKSIAARLHLDLPDKVVEPVSRFYLFRSDQVL